MEIRLEINVSDIVSRTCSVSGCRMVGVHHMVHKDSSLGVFGVVTG